MRLGNIAAHTLVTGLLALSAAPAQDSVTN